MSSRFLCLIASATTLLALSACDQLPPDHSPNYVQVPIVSPGRPHRAVGYELVPESCLVRDPTDTQLGPRLSPGCANDANLLATVERKSDLIHGRKLGASPRCSIGASGPKIYIRIAGYAWRRRQSAQPACCPGVKRSRTGFSKSLKTGFRTLYDGGRSLHFSPASSPGRGHAPSDQSYGGSTWHGRKALRILFERGPLAQRFVRHAHSYR